MNDSPCKHCERKGCGKYHDQCKRYKDFVENRQAYLEKKNIEQETKYSMNPQKKNAIRRKNRWR